MTIGRVCKYLFYIIGEKYLKLSIFANSFWLSLVVKNKISLMGSDELNLCLEVKLHHLNS